MSSPHVKGGERVNWFRVEFLGQHSEGRFRRENELMWEGGRGKSAMTLRLGAGGRWGQVQMS